MAFSGSLVGDWEGKYNVVYVGHYVHFCRRAGTLWSENCKNSVNQLNNANETYQF